jgi:hypothetical protein
LIAFIQSLDAKSVLIFAAGLATAWFVERLRSGSEYNHWLRQQRLAAFVDFVGSLDGLQRPMSRWQLSWEGPDEVPAREAFFDMIEVMERAGGAVNLLSGSPVNRASIRAANQWRNEMNSALKSHDQERLNRGFNAAQDRYTEFLDAARREIGHRDPFLSPQARREFEDAAKKLEMRNLPKT